jgi:hypothetical protein
MASLKMRLIGILRTGEPSGDWEYEEEDIIYQHFGSDYPSTKVVMAGHFTFRNAKTGERAYLRGKDESSVFVIPASQFKVTKEGNE